MSLAVRALAKRVGGETFIHETTLDLASDGFNVLLGATNAGKTSLMRLMAGLERPSAGQVLVNGQDVTKIPTRKRRVALVHQFFVNYPNFTVYENIASPLRIEKRPESEIRKRVDEAVALMKLEPYLTRRPSELSGGQQQRTALARAIVKDADMVLLDEPLANLDYKLREELRDQLPKLFADRGAVVVYATSEPTEALMLGGHTATLHEGRVTQYGPTPEVYRRPVDLITAQVFSDPPINSAPVTKVDGRIHMTSGASWPAEGKAATLTDGAYLLGVRPHYVSALPDVNASVPITGPVQITELSGSESIAHFELEGGSWVSQSHGVHPYRIGEPHEFHLDPSGCMYFHTDGRRVKTETAGTDRAA